MEERGREEGFRRESGEQDGSKGASILLAVAVPVIFTKMKSYVEVLKHWNDLSR